MGTVVGLVMLALALFIIADCASSIATQRAVRRRLRDEIRIAPASNETGADS